MISSKLSKQSYLCRLTPYLIISNIHKHNLRKQMQPQNTYKLTNQKSPNKFYIVHPSAKHSNKIQATFFYNNIPYSDLIRDSLEDILEDLISTGYTTITESIQHN